MSYRRIVVGTDGSETAERAVAHAGRLAGAFGAELVVVTAYSTDPTTARAREEAPDEVRWMVSDARGAEERAARGLAIARAEGATKVRHRAAPGDAAQALVETAEEVGADVIVVGNKGMASPTRFLLGSVPNKVTHHAPCDVLVVQTVA